MVRKLVAAVVLLCTFTGVCFAAQPTIDKCAPETYGGHPTVEGHPASVSTAAIQDAIDHCSAIGGGEVVLGPGRWITAPLVLKSNVTIRFEHGAVLQATKSKAGFVRAFIGWPARRGEALILANGVHNVGIVGDGSIVGNGPEWWPAAARLRSGILHGETKADFERKYPGVPLTNGVPRPWLVEFNDVSGGVISGIHLLQSPMWTLVVRSSHNIDIHDIVERNPSTVGNTDGIDIVSSYNINVRNANIMAGDDAISIKSGLKRGRLARAYNISIRDVVVRGHNGIAIGSETANNVGAVTIADVRFYGTESGIGLKQAQWRGGKVGPIVVKNVFMKNVKTPIYIMEWYGNKKYSMPTHGGKIPMLPSQPVTDTTPVTNGLWVDGLTATGATTAMSLSGLPKSPATQINMKNVSIRSEYGAVIRYVHGTFDNVHIIARHGRALDEGPGTRLVKR